MANPAPIIVRSSIATKPDIWVGQRVLLQVDVLARDGWAKINRAPDVEVPGAYMVRLETQGVRLNETVDGSAYTGQRYEMSLFPSGAAPLRFPPRMSSWR